MCHDPTGPCEHPFGLCKLWPFHLQGQEKTSATSEQTRFSHSLIVISAPFKSRVGLLCIRYCALQTPSLPKGTSRPTWNKTKVEVLTDFYWGWAIENWAGLIPAQRSCGRGEISWLLDLCWCPHWNNPILVLIYCRVYLWDCLLIHQQNKKPLLVLSSLCVSYSPYFSLLNTHLLEAVGCQLLCWKYFLRLSGCGEKLGSGRLKKVQIHKAKKHSSFPHHIYISDLLNVIVLWWPQDLVGCSSECEVSLPVSFTHPDMQRHWSKREENKDILQLQWWRHLLKSK